MKKMIALLLSACMIVGLTACGNKTNNPVKVPTDATSYTGPAAVPDPTEGPVSTSAYDETIYSKVTDATIDPTEATGNITTETKLTTATNATTATKATETTKPDPAKSPYNGKTIEIYGLGLENAYTNYAQYDGKHLWMMRAAVSEWAEINGVKLVFAGDYDQSRIISAVNAGECPDVIFHTEKFPAIANAGIVTSFTDVEYKKLANICGSGYLDMLNYKTKSFGFVLPWTSNTMCYYNKTMFDDYNVKTPKEYFMQGEWTWENFQKCMVEMTRDINGDGKNDTYGLPGDSLTLSRMVNPFKTDDAGMLLNTIDEPMIQDFFQFKYDVFTVKQCVIPSKNNMQTNVDFPMFAMQLSDCEPYNFEQMYQSLPNGNVLEVVPAPAYEGGSVLQWSQACASLAATCDERAAAIDMLSYLLKCGLKYMSDYSLGAVKCDYEGIQGFSALSAVFVEFFAELCESRAENRKKISNYDEGLIVKVYESFQNAQWYTYQAYTGVKLLTSYGEITQLPLESSVPKIKPKYEAEIKKYNEQYITES